MHGHDDRFGADALDYPLIIHIKRKCKGKKLFDG